MQICHAGTILYMEKQAGASGSVPEAKVWHCCRDRCV